MQPSARDVPGGSRLCPNSAADEPNGQHSDGAVRGSLRGTNLPVSLGQDVPSPNTGGDVALTDGLLLTVDTSEGAHQTSLSVDGLGDVLPVLQVNETTTYSTTAGLVYATHTATDTMTVGSLSFDLASTRVAALHYRGILGSADLTFRVQSHALTTYDPAGSHCDAQLPTGGPNPHHRGTSSSQA